MNDPAEMDDFFFCPKSFNHVDALLLHWMIGLSNCKVILTLYPELQLPEKKNFRCINHSQGNLVSTHPKTVIDPLPNIKIPFIQYQTGCLSPNPVDTQFLFLPMDWDIDIYDFPGVEHSTILSEVHIFAVRVVQTWQKKWCRPVIDVFQRTV